jgi:serine/threonine-protein kinase
VPNYADDTITEIDPRSARVVGRPIHVGRGPCEAAIANGQIWVANIGTGTVNRIDPLSRRVVGAPISAGRSPFGVVSAAGAIWVGDGGSRLVTRIDPRRARVAAHVRLPGRAALLAGSPTAIWVPLLMPNEIVRVDPRSNRLVGQPIRLRQFADRAFVAAGRVWVTAFDGSTVTRIQPG